MHVRIVTGAGGGPEKTILNSPRFLRQFGYDAVCTYLHPHNDPGIDVLKERARALQAELVSVPDGGIKDVSVVSALVKLCRERNVGIWHGHDYKSNALGLLVNRFHPMRLVTTVHGWVFHSPKTDLYYAVDRACLRHYERVVCVSESLLSECLAAGVPIDRLSLIENAIDATAYELQPDRAAAKRELGLPVDRPLIGAVGRLSPEKGFDVLIRAVAQLIESGTPACLAIAGEGQEKDKLQQLINESGRQSDIRLVGHLPDSRQVFNALDAFVLSSRAEGLPNVLLEAFACGIPTIATPVGGVPQVLAHEQNGLIVPVDDADAITVALTRLLNNPSLSSSLGAAGRHTVETRFSFRFRMQKMVAMYDELRGQPVKLFDHQFVSDVVEPADNSASHDVVDGLQDDSAASAFDRDSGPSGGQREAVAITTYPAEGHAVADYSTGTCTQELHRPLPHQTPSRQTQPTVPEIRTAKVLRMPVRVELTSSPTGWHEYLARKGMHGFYQRAEWVRVLEGGLQHQAACLQATEGNQLVGVLPLALVASPLFGRFLVSLPYVNSSGIVADSPEAEFALADRAVGLADQLKVRYLELRQERPIDHPSLVQAVTDKVHMRLALPQTTEQLWDGIKSKVRNQIRKAQKIEGFSVKWGQHDVLDQFYDIFCRNMRDLGTPPFSRLLFKSIVDQFSDAAEFCVVSLNGQAVASGLLIHGPGSTEVPSASALRQFNASNCNMLLYWNLLSRTVERGQATFDFGRSSRDSGTYAFKAQWGATESPAVWQHYVREGDARDMRPNNGKYDRVIQTWQKLPVWLTKLIGPSIVRGIP